VNWGVALCARCASRLSNANSIVQYWNKNVLLHAGANTKQGL
jgi:hypothetical protein